MAGRLPASRLRGEIGKGFYARSTSSSAPSWTGRGRPFGDADAEDEGRLPAGLAGESGERAAEMVGPAERLVAVGALDRLVHRLGGKACSGRREMQTLPGAAGGDRASHVQPVAHEDDSERRRGRDLDVPRHGEPIGVARLRAHVRQQSCKRRHRRRQARRVERHSVAMLLDFAPAAAEPAGAVGRHFGIPDDRDCRLDNQRAEVAAGGVFRHEGHAQTIGRSQIGEAAQLFRRKFSIRQIRAAIGMAPGDRAKEIVASFRTRRENDARSAERRVVRSRRKPPLRRLDRSVHAEGAGGQRQILDRCTEAEVHLAAKRIERAEIARPVGENLDRVVPGGEGPWLRIMRIGGENGGAQRPQPPVLRAAFPIPPRRIGRPLARRAKAPVPRPVAEPRQRHGKHAAADQNSAPSEHHNLFPQGYDPSDPTTLSAVSAVLSASIALGA